MATSNRKHQAKDRSVESELKFRLGGPAEQARIRSQLRGLGAKRVGAYDEENVRYAPHRKNQLASLRLRILDGGPAGVLTAKGPARFLRTVKTREETEVPIADARAMREILEVLGFREAIIYHKHREIWNLEPVLVTLDTLEFGFYCEIEGPVDALEGGARQLALNPNQALKLSYSALARRHLSQSAPKRSLLRLPDLPTVANAP